MQDTEVGTRGWFRKTKKEDISPAIPKPSGGKFCILSNLISLLS
jgi:hypothetical protein